MLMHVAVTTEPEDGEWVCTCICGEAFTAPTQKEAMTLHSAHMIEPR